jgi:YidC/Oxa1 family membrane protein insertase
MERRVLIAVLLSFAVLYGYQLLFPPPPDQAKKPATGSSQQAAPSAPSPALPPPSPAPAAAPATASPSTPATDSAATDVIVDTPGVHAVFTTRAGALKSWHLKQYRDPSGQPLELTAAHAPAGAPLPFTLAVDDPGTSARLASADFQSSTDHLDVSSGSHTLTFEYRDGASLEAKKTLTFDAAHPYAIAVNATVTKDGQSLPVTVDWGPAIGSGVVPKSRTYNPPPGALYYTNGKVFRVKADKLSTAPVQEGAFGFAGVDDHYFLSVLVAPPQPVRVSYEAIQASFSTSAEPAHYVSWAVRFPSSVEGATFFFGPKDFDVLASMNRDLVRSIDFGIFAWLVVPLLRALKWLNGYIHNYGWSVVALTVLINLAMFPLRHKSVVSMRKMQEIQPEVKAIQDRYKNLKMSDPARSKMNTELMNLYRERGVNPASGCVPMLLTLPVLFAFYSMLSVAIELRGAHWVGWIHDLSAPDPWYILPVLMGLSMFIQQKMTPTTADPTQQTMMLIMPVVLTVSSFWWASGLLLYWTTSNIWGIGQQMITNKIIGAPPVRTLRPPAERQIKRAGGGKTDQASKERK